MTEGDAQLCTVWAEGVNTLAVPVKHLDAEPDASRRGLLTSTALGIESMRLRQREPIYA